MVNKCVCFVFIIIWGSYIIYVHINVSLYAQSYDIQP